MEERLHKVLAAAGVASRREAERWIAAGRVAVDGRVITEMGVKVDPARQRILVDGWPVALPERMVYVLLNKPKGFVTTRSDPHARHTVMELMDEVAVPVHPVGRLDKDTEGALIFTNDGGFTNLLTHPRHEVEKVYVAHVKGVPGEKALERLRAGIRLEEGVTAPARVKVLHTDGEDAVLEMVLREGRKRQVRRMLEAVGHPVDALRRVAIGPVSTRKLPTGAWRYLSQKEVAALRKAATAGDVGEPRRPDRRRHRAARPSP
ncbi:MAG: rRNA pseudouridine synthase [Armatimonadetes bacterium]|nr:rRNA pseudouridine synthase [Armatimonadota bacterium]